MGITEKGQKYIKTLYGLGFDSFTISMMTNVPESIIRSFIQKEKLVEKTPQEAVDTLINNQKEVKEALEGK